MGIDKSLDVLHSLDQHASQHDQRLLKRVANVKELAETLITGAQMISDDRVITDSPVSTDSEQEQEQSDHEQDNHSSSSSVPSESNNITASTLHSSSIDSINDETYQRLCKTLHNLIQEGNLAVNTPTRPEPSGLSSNHDSYYSDSDSDSTPILPPRPLSDTFLSISSNSSSAHTSPVHSFQRQRRQTSKIKRRNVKDIFKKDNTSSDESSDEPSAMYMDSPSLTQSIRGVKGELRRVELLTRQFLTPQLNEFQEQDSEFTWQDPFTTPTTGLWRRHHVTTQPSTNSAHSSAPVHNDSPASILAVMLMYNPVIFILLLIYRLGLLTAGFILSDDSLIEAARNNDPSDLPPPSLSPPPSLAVSPRRHSV